MPPNPNIGQYPKHCMVSNTSVDIRVWRPLESPQLRGSQERVSQPHKGNDNQDVRPECNYALHDNTLTSVCEAVTASSRLRDKPSANSVVHVWPVRTHRPWRFQEEQTCLQIGHCGRTFSLRIGRGYALNVLRPLLKRRRIRFTTIGKICVALVTSLWERKSLRKSYYEIRFCLKQLILRT
jgi:hypothetical protein